MPKIKHFLKLGANSLTNFPIFQERNLLQLQSGPLKSLGITSLCSQQEIGCFRLKSFVAASSGSKIIKVLNNAF